MSSHFNVLRPTFKSSEGRPPKWNSDNWLYHMRDAVHPVDGLDPWFGVPVVNRGLRSHKLRFGSEMARALRPETMVFLAEMYAQVPYDETQVVRGQHTGTFDKFFRSGPNISERGDGVLGSTFKFDRAKDEIWMLLPPKSYANDCAYRSKLGALLHTVDDFVVYMLAKHFYKQYLGAKLSDMTLHNTINGVVDVVVQGGGTICATYRSNNKNARSARHSLMQQMLVSLGELYLAEQFFKAGEVAGSYTFADPTPWLEAFERLCSLRGTPAINAWVEHNRRHRPAERATAELLVAGEEGLEFWC